MPLRLDVEVHVVDVGRQRTQPFDLAIDDVRILHRDPLIGRPRLRDQRVHAADDPTDLALGLRVFHHALANLQRQIANRDQVLVRLGGEADHVVELQVLDAVGKNQIGAIENFVVGHGLVDHATQTIGSGFRRDGNRSLAALLQHLDDGLRQIVETQRCGTDGVAHLQEVRENAFDVGMIAERNRHQADAARMRPRLARELQNAIGWKRANRQVVVAGPAKAAQVGAPSDDFHQEA